MSNSYTTEQKSEGKEASPDDKGQWLIDECWKILTPDKIHRNFLYKLGNNQLPVNEPFDGLVECGPGGLYSTLDPQFWLHFGTLLARCSIPRHAQVAQFPTKMKSSHLFIHSIGPIPIDLYLKRFVWLNPDNHPIDNGWTTANYHEAVRLWNEQRTTEERQRREEELRASQLRVEQSQKLAAQLAAQKKKQKKKEYKRRSRRKTPANAQTVAAGQGHCLLNTAERLADRERQQQQAQQPAAPVTEAERRASIEEKARQVQAYLHAKPIAKHNFATLDRALLDNPRLLQTLPVAQRTYLACLYAVGQLGWLLQFVPPNHRTLEMCQAAASNGTSCMPYVPVPIKRLLAK